MPGQAASEQQALRMDAAQLAQLRADFFKAAAGGGTLQAVMAFRERLRPYPLDAVIAFCRDLMECNAQRAAAGILEAAMAQHPGSREAKLWFAEALRQSEAYGPAEALLRALCAAQPDYADAAFSLAATLRHQGRINEAAEGLAAFCRRAGAGTELTVRCARFINDCQRVSLALQLCESQLVGSKGDPALYAVAGAAALEMGEFERARMHFRQALEIDPAGCAYLLQSLAHTKRFGDPEDPNFQLFDRFLSQPGLSREAKASILFGKGKALDDLGDFASAATALREANALMLIERPWSAVAWRELVKGRLRRTLAAPGVAPDPSFVPIFIVGLPRSGTTLAAEMLGRHPQVCNRGELDWIHRIEQRLTAAAALQDPAALAGAANWFRIQVRQDDPPARWYVDKNPLNFRDIDLIIRLFPNARIVHCRRELRDNALSIWKEFFSGNDNAYCFDLNHIAALAQGCLRLMEHWSVLAPAQIHTIDYERLCSDPTGTLAGLSDFVGLPSQHLADMPSKRDTAIRSASVWQARQPVYTHSIGRWQLYAPHLPELLRAFPGDTAAA